MAEETLVDALLAQLETRRLMTGWCIAYREDGRVCRAPATIVDRQGHGLVCAAHAPAAATEYEAGGPPADEAHDERFRQHEAILEGLAKVWTRQGEINEELRAFNQQQGEINQDVKTTLARIETLLQRVVRGGENGREA